MKGDETMADTKMAEPRAPTMAKPVEADPLWGLKLPQKPGMLLSVSHTTWLLPKNLRLGMAHLLFNLLLDTRYMPV